MNKDFIDRTARDYLWYTYGYIQRNMDGLTKDDLKGLEIALENAIAELNAREYEYEKAQVA